MTPVRQAKVSQQEIARDLGVSQALVSMVLNGKDRNVHLATARRIVEHARKVGYVSKTFRREMPGFQNPHLTQVGFLVRPGHNLYSQSSFFSHVHHGLHRSLLRYGLDTLYLGTEETVGEEGWSHLDRHAGKLLGVVVIGEVDLGFLREVKRRFPRMVAVAASYAGYCHSVLNNEAKMMELLVEHLVDLGHRRLAWLGGNAGSLLLARRQNALFQALARHDLAIPPEQIEVFEAPRQRQGQEAAERLLDRFGRDDLPTAWIAYNARMARGAIHHLLTQQIDVAGQVSVVACDGTYVCDEEDPAITAAYADPEQIGEKAGELLLKATGEPDEAFTELMLPAKLTVRESTAKLTTRVA